MKEIQRNEIEKKTVECVGMISVAYEINIMSKNKSFI